TSVGTRLLSNTGTKFHPGRISYTQPVGWSSSTGSTTAVADTNCAADNASSSALNSTCCGIDTSGNRSNALNGCLTTLCAGSLVRLFPGRYGLSTSTTPNASRGRNNPGLRGRTLGILTAAPLGTVTLYRWYPRRIGTVSLTRYSPIPGPANRTPSPN